MVIAYGISTTVCGGIPLSMQRHFPLLFDVPWQMLTFVYRVDVPRTTALQLVTYLTGLVLF